MTFFNNKRESKFPTPRELKEIESCLETLRVHPNASARVHAVMRIRAIIDPLRNACIDIENGYIKAVSKGETIKGYKPAITYNGTRVWSADRDNDVLGDMGVLGLSHDEKYQIRTPYQLEYKLGKERAPQIMGSLEKYITHRSPTVRLVKISDWRGAIPQDKLVEIINNKKVDACDRRMFDDDSPYAQFFEA